MSWLRLIPWVVAALAVGAAAWLWSANQDLNEEVGGLKRDKAALQESLQVKENARKSRSTTDGAVRRMAPADKLDRLR